MPPPTRTPAPAPALPDEIIEEIFLRLPPNEPACLVRASLTSKLWFAILSGPSFHGRYHEFHGAPPMLGFVYYRPKHYVREPANEGPLRHFVSTTKFGARITDGDMRDWDYDARDCRHGRVLLGHGGTLDSPTNLVIWNPMTGSRKEFQAPASPKYQTYGAAVLCAVTGCDHRACHEGPVRVVLVRLQDMDDGGCVASAHVFLQHEDAGCESSSHFDELSEPCSSLNLPEDANIDRMPPVLIKDALYFMVSYDYDDDDDDEDYDYNYDGRRVVILKYDLVSNCLSLIDGPPVKTYIDGSIILLAMEDGSLGFARVKMLTLHLWSRKMGCDGVAPWTACRVIDLEEFLPIQNPKKRLWLIGSMEGRDVIFVTTDLGIYEISLKTLRWKKIWKSRTFLTLIPYMSFYNP